MSNIGDFLRRLCGTDGIGLDTPPLPGGSVALVPVIHQAFDFWVDFDKVAADGAAATTTADTFIWSNPYDFPLVLLSATLIGLGAGIVADPANFATIALKTDNGAGGATAVALSLTTTVADLGTLVSNVAKSFTTVTGANVIIPPKGNIWFNIAKSGTGVVVPISSYVLRLGRGEF